MNKKRKIVPVGCGLIGMSVMYGFLNTGRVDELVPIDVNQEETIGEAMDSQHGLPYARGEMSIKAGDYEECRGAVVIVITVGVTQKPTKARLNLTARDTVIMKSITEQIMASGLDGILVTASSPVDAMTYVAQKVSGLPTERVIGSGAILDTVRLHHMMSKYLDVSTSNIRAYTMGEHDDSSFVSWANAYAGCKSPLDLLGGKDRDLSDLHDICINVQQVGYEVVKRRRSTYYGIGLSLNRLVRAILDNENVIPTASAYQNNEYGQEGLHIGVPAAANHQGIREVVKLDLNEVDQVKFNQSCGATRGINTDTVDPLLQKINSALPVQCAGSGKPGVPAYRDRFFPDCR